MRDDVSVLYCFVTSHPKPRGLQQQQSRVWLLNLHGGQDRPTSASRSSGRGGSQVGLESPESSLIDI